MFASHAFPALLVGYLGCSSTPAIEGVVTDHAGAALDGVRVTVRKSAYEATTNEQGRYTLAYAPGRFDVAYQLDGYTTTVVELDIQESVNFPAAAVELIPIPAGPGLYMLTAAGTEPLTPGKMEKQVASASWFETSYKIFCTADGGPEVSAGTIRVVDTLPDVVGPARLGGYGLVRQPKDMAEEIEAYDGVFTDEKARVGEQGLTVRTLQVTQGQHAFVGLLTDRSGVQNVDVAKPCYPFLVK